MFLLIRIIVFLIILNTVSYSFIASSIELFEKIYLESKLILKVNKIEFAELLLKNPYNIKAFTALNKYQKMQLYMDISKIPKTKQGFYLRIFNELDNGDKLLINAIRENKSLDKVYLQVTRRRRITNLEKELMISQNAKKDFIFGRSIIKRDIFECSKSNIVLMKKGLAPIGKDGFKVHLHHLKQQKNGNLIELTQTEHNQHSSILHRYIKKGSEITDRGSQFQLFRTKYWKYRAIECITRRD